MTEIPTTAQRDGGPMSRRLQMAPAAPAEMNRVDVAAAERAPADLLVALGADLELEGLRETPRRVAAAYAELLTPEPFDLTTFPNEGGYDGSVLVRDIPFQSLCMHHLLPFHEIECDFAVVGIGVSPRTRLAEDAGLQIDNGIVVDDKLQTSASNVFAAGDVASARHPFYRQHIRVQLFSDQCDVGMEYSGFATQLDEVVFRGSRDAGEFIAFWLKDGRVAAGINVNVWDVNEHVQALIHSRSPVDAAALADFDTPLESLIGEPARS